MIFWVIASSGWYQGLTFLFSHHEIPREIQVFRWPRESISLEYAFGYSSIEISVQQLFIAVLRDTQAGHREEAPDSRQAVQSHCLGSYTGAGSSGEAPRTSPRVILTRSV